MYNIKIVILAVLLLNCNRARFIKKKYREDSKFSLVKENLVALDSNYNRLYISDFKLTDTTNYYKYICFSPNNKIRNSGIIYDTTGIVKLFEDSSNYFVTRGFYTRIEKNRIKLESYNNICGYFEYFNNGDTILHSDKVKFKLSFFAEKSYADYHLIHKWQ